VVQMPCSLYHSVTSMGKMMLAQLTKLSAFIHSKKAPTMPMSPSCFFYCFFYSVHHTASSLPHS
jgi:hypothetical protein